MSTYVDLAARDSESSFCPNIENWVRKRYLEVVPCEKGDHYTLI
jgi:hypothetical protein